MALCKLWGWGLSGRATETESSSILAWSLLASPLGMGHLHRASSCSCPAEQMQRYGAGRGHFLDVPVVWLSFGPPQRHTSSEALPAALHGSG